ncbi:MAG TPA: alpha-amylase family glycosyl hydrolase [Anaerolineales bacterium]|nr:alpha-amylase family glycosyl hydrolase [Anaerolineales bacterium]
MEKPASQHPWWKTGVIYQIYPRSFLDTTGNGIGDLEGIIARLDYLNDGTPDSLGVDAIWISPFYPSPMADFGYDVSDYCDIHPELGDLAIFDRLVAEAHRRGIRVILDYVPNHTSDEHAWFKESRRSRENPRRDWYIWRDPAPDGGPPNNWGSVFGGSAWEWDEETGQYYFHQFLREQPDLNWRNPLVVDAMKDVLRFWLDRGVDGFRMDVVGMIFKHPDMPDQPPDPDAPDTLRPNDLYSRQLHLYDQDQDEVYEMVREFNRLTRPYGEICLIGEILWYGAQRWLRYYGQDGDGFHLPMNLQFMHLPWEAKTIKSAVVEIANLLPDYAWPSTVLGNHDEVRLASRYGREHTRLAAMLLLTLRGTPILYYGDEIGLENGVNDGGEILDPWGIIVGPEYNRDVCRTPMQWDASAHAGFSTEAPWLPVSPDAAGRNVHIQRADPNSLLNLYRDLLRRRRGSPALTLGDLALFEGPPDCLVYERRAEGERLWIALNFGSEPADVPLPGPGTLLRSTADVRRGGEVEGSVGLGGYEGVLVWIASTEGSG